MYDQVVKCQRAGLCLSEHFFYIDLCHVRVCMSQQLRHENLVNLIEVFCRKKHLYLVFEFVDHTVLDDLDQCSAAGLDEDTVRRILWQVLKGIHFCHVHNVSPLRYRVSGLE